ncbi:tyrosine-type recombinase/integrase [Micromonospora aurantiaca (nom. illeg.)]|uniref:tyrosine-type recombinase/integrase n=1 Tax=Micromonospora aurantiaca (nom. illeg.) TaxID=47850 RepID=UPI0021D5F551|nr:tyrosine-type recombinase/integrase [Micromonospora aurantiaca]
MHEVEGKLFLGPPKTNDSVRHIRLPRFLTNLLATHLAEHSQDTVFAGARGYHQRRSNFNRRAWTPAVAGDPERGIPPILPGMHFHDLRHTHKTWLIEDGIPEIAQARRLGHRLAGVRGIYSHVTEPMVDNLIDALQRRWEATQPDDAASVVRRLRPVALPHLPPARLFPLPVFTVHAPRRLSTQPSGPGPVRVLVIEQARVPQLVETCDVVVVGGGQAGLAAGSYLRRAGLDYVILDA